MRGVNNGFLLTSLLVLLAPLPPPDPWERRVPAGTSYADLLKLNVSRYASFLPTGSLRSQASAEELPKLPLNLLKEIYVPQGCIIPRPKAAQILALCRIPLVQAL